MTAQPATDDKSGTRTSRPGQLITCVGLVAGALSLVQTIGHISDAAYLIPGLEDGSGHVHYHLARETMVTLDSFGVILLGLFAPRRSRTSLLWWLMWISSVDLQPRPDRRHPAGQTRVYGTHTNREVTRND